MQRPFSFFLNLYSVLFIYLTPTNLSYMWNFGSLALVFLFVQILTGLCLSWWYIPHVDWAFFSVEFIMREVVNGWLIRYIHANGASFFFSCYLFSYCSFVVLFVLSSPSFVCLVVRFSNLPFNDLNSVSRLCFTLGSNEFLGCHRYYKFSHCYSISW